MWRLGPLILRNVLRNRRRSLLTLASTAVSLALLALLIAMYQGFFYGEDISPSEALRLICRHRVSLTQSLPASHQARIKAMPGVAACVGVDVVSGRVQRTEEFLRATSRSMPTSSSTSARIGRCRRISSRRSSAIAPPARSAKKIAKKYGIKLGDRVTIVGDIYPVTLELTVRRDLTSIRPIRECLVFHREYLTELLPARRQPPRDSVGTYMILADSPAGDVPRIAKAIDTMFENSPYPTRTESEKEFGRSFLAFLGNIKLFLAGDLRAR